MLHHAGALGYYRYFHYVPRSLSTPAPVHNEAPERAGQVALRRYLTVFSFANAEDAFAGDPRGLADRTSLRTVASALPS